MKSSALFVFLAIFSISIFSQWKTETILGSISGFYTNVQTSERASDGAYSSLFGFAGTPLYISGAYTLRGYFSSSAYNSYYTPNDIGLDCSLYKAAGVDLIAVFFGVKTGGTDLMVQVGDFRPPWDISWQTRKINLYPSLSDKKIDSIYIRIEAYNRMPSGTMDVEVAVDRLIFYYGEHEQRQQIVDSFGDPVVGVNESNHSIPKEFILYQNYPNPFNPFTAIQYDVPKQSRIHISVLNILGEKIAELVNRDHSPGKYSVRFDGDGFPSGAYFVRMESENTVFTKKIVLLK